jgi:hypothetical protein
MIAEPIRAVTSGAVQVELLDVLLKKIPCSTMRLRVDQ